MKPRLNYAKVAPGTYEGMDALDRSTRTCHLERSPHAFVLDALAARSPETRPMFGSLAVYVRDKIVFVLRDKSHSPAENGVWIATTREHHESLRAMFPNMRSIQVLGRSPTGWQLLPADASDFEESALRACELVLANDPRIGKLPQVRRRVRKKSR